MIRKKILVKGGAGYIGSFIIRELDKSGFEPFIADDFSSGHKDAIKGFRYKKINLTEQKEKLAGLFAREKFDGVIHMASFIQMGESFINPGKYFANNLNSALNLFDTMVRSGCLKVIFSSSAGVYGTPKSLPIKEEDSKNPENPYGETKLMIEKFLSWYDKAHSLKSISIRYFNAAGASLDGELGEDHPDESHIIPLIVKAALSKGTFNLYGNDYKTHDGTCVRDYVHVLDLAKAHVLALKSLFNGAETDCYNAGIGRGYSNLQIIDEIKKLTGDFNVVMKQRRAGDADALYASTVKISKNLGWKPEHDMKDIVGSAYLWHKKHPSGFEK